VNNGEIGVVVIDGEATLKRVYYYPGEEKLVLTPENPKYAPLVYLGKELSQIRVIGRAIAFQSKL
jgi:repressor LexA